MNTAFVAVPDIFWSQSPQIWEQSPHGVAEFQAKNNNTNNSMNSVLMDIDDLIEEDNQAEQDFELDKGEDADPI